MSKCYKHFLYRSLKIAILKNSSSIFTVDIPRDYDIIFDYKGKKKASRFKSFIGCKYFICLPICTKYGPFERKKCKVSAKPTIAIASWANFSATLENLKVSLFLRFSRVAEKMAQLAIAMVGFAETLHFFRSNGPYFVQIGKQIKYLQPIKLLKRDAFFLPL